MQMHTTSQSEAVAQAVDVLLKSSSYYFSRAFLLVSKNRTAVNLVNRMFEAEKEMESTLITLSLMPVLVWMQGAEDLDVISNTVYERDENIDILSKSKNLIADILGDEPLLIMEKRKDYFNKLRSLVVYVTDKIDSVIGSYPGDGCHYADMLGYFYLGRPAKYSITAYTIKMYLPGAIRLLHKVGGEEIKVGLEGILQSNSLIGGDEELQFIYHNISLLLEEYTKIKWAASNCDDKAVRLLACNSEEEMLKITQSDSRYWQAYTICQFITLIHNAIIRLKSFPYPGLYKVVYTMIDGKRKGQTDIEIAYLLDMPLSKYRQLIRIALAVLSAELFGVDCNIFIDILSGC